MEVDEPFRDVWAHQLGQRQKASPCMSFATAPLKGTHLTSRLRCINVSPGFIALADRDKQYRNPITSSILFYANSKGSIVLLYAGVPIYLLQCQFHYLYARRTEADINVEHLQKKQFEFCWDFLVLRIGEDKAKDWLRVILACQHGLQRRSQTIDIGLHTGLHSPT
jgi:hypothetical protein